MEITATVLPASNFPNFPLAAQEAARLCVLHDRPVEVVGEDGRVIRSYYPRPSGSDRPMAVTYYNPPVARKDAHLARKDAPVADDGEVYDW